MSEAVDTRLRKVLSENIREALSAVSTKGEFSKEKIKAARKSIKKVRTLLRLLSLSIKGSWLKTEEDLLKDISRQFKGLRDIFIIEEVFKEIIPLLKKEKVDCDPNEILKLFESLESETITKFQSDKSKLRSIIGDLQVANERLDEMLFKVSPWESIEDGLVKTYKSCHKIYKDLSKNPSNEECISLRKLVNFLFIELNFLSAYLKPEAKEFLKKVDVFSKEMGHVQDTILVFQAIKENKKQFASPEQYKNLTSFLETHQHQLVQTVREKGKLIFESSPKSFFQKIIENEQVKDEKKKFKEKKTSLG